MPDMINFRITDAAINETVEVVDVQAIRVRAIMSDKIGEVIPIHNGSIRITTESIRVGQSDSNRK